MTKEEMVRDLMQILREKRHQVYVDSLSRILVKVDKDKQKKFVQAFYQGIERVENLAMEHYDKLFNGFSEDILNKVFSHPVGSAFGHQYMPTVQNIDAITRIAVHVVTCSNCASQLYN